MFSSSDMKTIGLILIVSVYIVWANDNLSNESSGGKRLQVPTPSTITSEPYPIRRKGKFLGLLGLVAGLHLIDEHDDDDENSIGSKTFDFWDPHRSSKIAVVQKNGRFELSKF